jgi:amino acid adenylation domain-containing protein
MNATAAAVATQRLHDWLDQSAHAWPHRTAVREPEGGAITYADLAALADRVRDRLAHLGVRPGDRVGVYCEKTIDAVAAIFGALKTGAAYVPVDPHAPASRNAYIFANCAVAAVIAEVRFAPDLVKEMQALGAAPPLFLLQGAGGGGPLAQALDREQAADPAPEVASHESAPDDLAYILYTSGSTGRPKGVMLTHKNGTSYVDWCSEVFQPTCDDSFSSHAPFHFDLSILDIYVPLKHGATLVLFGHELGKNPQRLAATIAGERLTVWYSAPSILSMLAEHGNLASLDLKSLRLVLFAGEVFPVKHLRALKKLLPHPRYFNLYGPTETNVCTFHEIPVVVEDDRTEPYPIGKTCSHLQSRVIDPEGRDVPSGEEGELVIRGPGVTQGYWNLPEQTNAAFVADSEGGLWYHTGDVVYADGSGDFVFRGRRDRMVKKRGYRVELGEIEACLYRHPAVRQAAVIAMDGEDGVRIKAFVCPRQGEKLSLIAMKSFCASHLPVYMVPDLFAFNESLPTTSTDKVDYQRLKQMA